MNISVIRDKICDIIQIMEPLKNFNTTKRVIHLSLFIIVK